MRVDEDVGLGMERRGPTPPVALTAERLAHLPSAWLEAMRVALADGAIENAKALAAEIEASDRALASDVHAMLAGYRLDELEDVLAAAGGSSPPL